MVGQLGRKDGAPLALCLYRKSAGMTARTAITAAIRKNSLEHVVERVLGYGLGERYLKVGVGHAGCARE